MSNESNENQKANHRFFLIWVLMSDLYLCWRFLVSYDSITLKFMMWWSAVSPVTFGEHIYRQLGGVMYTFSDHLPSQCRIHTHFANGTR
jgi:hypothetical protein